MPDRVLRHFGVAGPSYGLGPEHTERGKSVRRFIEASSYRLPSQGPASCRQGAEGLFELRLQDQAFEPTRSCSVPYYCEVVADHPRRAP